MAHARVPILYGPRAYRVPFSPAFEVQTAKGRAGDEVARSKDIGHARRRFFEHPILNSSYEYPTQHREFDKQGQPTQKIIVVHDCFLGANDPLEGDLLSGRIKTAESSQQLSL